MKKQTRDSKAGSLVIVLTLSLFFGSFVTTNALNITRLLSRYPNLLAFSDLLTQTKLDEDINKRQTITILAVDNSSLGGLDGRPVDEIQRILSNHVVLDYFDMIKLKKMEKNETLTTLFQSSGVANGRQGFLTLTKLPGNEFVFGSAVKDSPPVAKLVGQVYARPYNVSILQVSQPIVAPGLGKEILPPPPPPYTPPPAMPPKNGPPSKRPKYGPAPSDESDEAESPTEEAPAEAPVGAPVPAPAPEPVAADPSPPAPEEEANADTGSGGSRPYVGSALVVAALMGVMLNSFVRF